MNENIKKQKTYSCPICHKKFDKHNGYWYHINRSKKFCISKEAVLEKINVLEDEVSKIPVLENEIDLLKQQITVLEYKNDKETIVG